MKKKRRKIILYSVIVLVSAIIVLIVFRTSDISPPYLSDLMIEYHPIPEDENALTILKEANILLDDFYDNTTLPDEVAFFIVPIDEYNPKDMEQLIAENTEVFKLFEKAIELKRLQFPEVTHLNQRIPYLAPLRHFNRLQINRSLHFFKNGDEKKAFDLLIDDVRFGTMIEKGGGDEIHFLVGRSIKGTALTRFREFLSETDLNSDSLRPYISELSNYSEDTEDYIFCLKSIFRLFSWMIDECSDRKMIEPDYIYYSHLWEHIVLRYYLKPNKTKLLLANGIRECISNAKDPTHWDETYKCSVPVIMSFKDFLLKGENSRGKDINSYQLAFINMTIESRKRAILSLNTTRLLIALKCYKLENGDLPDFLDELVPDYIDAVPIDDYDGKPLRYSKDKKIIYSVGPDMKDTGGPTIEELEKEDKPGSVLWNVDDPAFKIDF